MEPFFEEVSGDDPMAGTSQKWNYLKKVEPTHFFCDVGQAFKHI